MAVQTKCVNHYVRVFLTFPVAVRHASITHANVWRDQNPAEWTARHNAESQR